MRDLSSLLLFPFRFGEVFRIAYEGQYWRVATCGYAIALERTQAGHCRDGIAQSLPTEWSEPFSTEGLPRRLEGATDFYVACTVCDRGAIKVFPCVECEDDDPPGECEACGGDRKQYACPECEGDFDRVLAPTQEGLIGDRALNRNLVRTYLAPFGAPRSIQLAKGAPDWMMPVRFNGDDWTVIVMPMRVGTETGERPVLKLDEAGSL